MDGLKHVRTEKRDAIRETNQMKTLIQSALCGQQEIGLATGDGDIRQHHLRGRTPHGMLLIAK